jgi:hypothetical protein
MTVQYRIQVSKKEERVEGPDDADVVITIPFADAGLDPTVAYMRGKLKATGHTGALLDELASGRAAAVIARLAAG